MAYVDGTGVHMPTVEQLREAFTAQQRANISPNVDTASRSFVGNMNGIYASHLREIAEMGEDAYHAWDPGAARGDALDIISSITGTIRRETTRSQLAGTRAPRWDLDAGTFIPAGSTFYHPSSPAQLWRTKADRTAVGAGFYGIDSESVDYGPITLAAGVLVISPPISGANSLEALHDAVPGNLREDDVDLRNRRRNELAGLGASTTGALYVALERLQNPDGTFPILKANVLDNDTDFPDSNGVPAHTVAPLIYDGPAQAALDIDVANIIRDHKPGGVGTHGAVHVNTTLSNGDPITISFTRITASPLTIDIDVSTDDTYPGNDALAAALAAAGRRLQQIGGDAIWSKYVAAAEAVSGVTVISISLNGLAPQTTAPADTYEIWTVDTSDVNII